MKKRNVTILSLLMSLLVSISIITPINVFANTTDGQKRVIVVYKNSNKVKLFNSLSSDSIKINKRIDSMNASALTVNDEQLSKLKADSNVSYIEEDIKLKINSQTIDWGIGKIGAQSTWSNGYTGKGVKIAILDTGIAIHPDLLISGGTSIVDYTTSYSDDNGHGTHVAGIVGAKNNTLGIVGVAPDSNIYAVKVLDSVGEGYLSDIISGIDWSIANNMDIINLSFGTNEDSPLLHDEINKALNKGILVVSAAGNSGNAEGTGDNIDYPARYDGVISVGSVDQSNLRASDSATGTELSICAPGVSILSTYINNGYGVGSGTSMASPFVAGSLALLKEANPTASNQELKNTLFSNTLDLGAKGKDNLYGNGLLQISSSKIIPINSTTPANSNTTANGDLGVNVIVDPTITLTLNTNSVNFGNVSPLTASYELPSVLVIGIQSNNVYTLSAKVNNDFVGTKGFKMPSSLLNIKEHNNNYVSFQNGVKNDLVSNQAPTSGTNYNIDLKLKTDYNVKPDTYSNIINISVNQI